MINFENNINEMGLAQDHLKKKQGQNFEKFKKFFENLWMMAGYYVYLIDINGPTKRDTSKNKKLSMPIYIFGTERNIADDRYANIELPNASAQLQSNIYSNEYFQKIIANLSGLYCYLFDSNSNWMHLIFPDDIYKRKSYFGFIGLDDTEIRALCKVGFKKDTYNISVCGEEDKHYDSISISLADLYDNIDQIYAVMYE